MTNPLTWNVAANRKFESGLDRGVVYPRDVSGNYPLGISWEGLISVSEKPGGAEATDLWANNVKYAQLFSAETFDGSIEAYTYPIEFQPCDGVAAPDTGVYASQQTRTPFGMSYRTWVGSEAAGQQNTYKIHVVYGATVQPSEQGRNTINDSPEALTFSWEFKTTPAPMTGYNPVSKLVLDMSLLSANAIIAVEEALYGDGTADPFLPLPDALLVLAQTA